MATELTSVVAYTDGNEVIAIYTATSGYTFISSVIGTGGLPSEIHITAEASISKTETSSIFVTITTTVPSATLTRSSPTLTSTEDTTAIALSSIASYNSIQATATDPYIKSRLSFAISQFSSWASLSDGYTTTGSGSGRVMSRTRSGNEDTPTTTASGTRPSGTLSTLSPPEQTALDQEIKHGNRQLIVHEVLGWFFGLAIFLLAIWLVSHYFVRLRRRRKGRNAPLLTEYVSPNLGSFNGLMAEMGRENSSENHESRAEGLQRVPRVPRSQSNLHEAALPEGIAELPGYGPEIEPTKDCAGLHEEGVVDSAKIDCAMREKGLKIH
ncbi:hypothetical protein NHQ30_007613 [Ciborinia camelliae]|nr:hypothetical protein NHQ30_007613 [Ciborinia camelliae]